MANKQYNIAALLIGGVACVSVLATGITAADGASCTQEVLFGRLLVIDASIGAFVLQGRDEEFVAPPRVDVSVFDGQLVRIDFDGQCAVRTILRAERLEGPTIEA